MNQDVKTVRIVSPSGVINPDFIDGAGRLFESFGYRVIIGKYAKESYGRFAGTDEHRLFDLQMAMDDPDAEVILCSRGGYGLCRIVDKLDFSSIKECPKFLTGFSDITVLHNALTIAGLPSVHGVMAKHLTEFSIDDPAVQQLFRIFNGELPVYTIPSQPENKTGSSEGKLIGGNLSVLMGLRSTPFDLMPENAILFLEEIGESWYHIDRMLQNLRLSGVFDKIQGLILGHFTDCPEDASMMSSFRDIVLNATSGYRFPVCFGFPAGHENRNLPLIMGAPVALDVRKNEVRISFS
jgi:muramoyltetrapeptide carboxypeptidase